MHNAYCNGLGATNGSSIPFCCHYRGFGRPALQVRATARDLAHEEAPEGGLG